MSDMDTMGKGGRAWPPMNYRALYICPKSSIVLESYKTPTSAPVPSLSIDFSELVSECC